MPSGRDSFRRNRVAPGPYFNTPRAGSELKVETRELEGKEAGGREALRQEIEQSPPAKALLTLNS